MRTIKQKIKIWKVIAVTLAIPLLFFIISCQDQLAHDSLSGTDNLPEEAEKRFTQFKESYPGSAFIVEFNEKANTKLTQLENEHGHATHIELFTITVSGEQRNFAMIQYLSGQPTEKSDFLVSPDKETFSAIAQDEEVFTVVENSPEVEGGYGEMVRFISKELKYPTKARMDGKEGTVFVQFIVEKNGSLSNVVIVRGVEASMDAEAMRVVKMTKWKPGMHNGKAVRVRFVLPVKYKL